jgi:hypothetical protein
MSVSSRGVGQGIVTMAGVSEKRAGQRMPIKAALIEEGIA